MAQLDMEAEKMIQVFSDWLNKHHEANGETHRVIRDHYNEWDDAPRVLFDENVFPGSILERRALCLYTSPYHDEGGPNILTGFFAYDDLNGWSLDTLLQYFDTEDHVVYINGAYEPTSLPEEAQ
jgi:hypothetical protein